MAHGPHGAAVAGRLAVGPTRLGTPHWRRAARLAPSLIVAWAATAFVAARVVGLEPPDGETAATALTRSAILGVVLGSVGAWLETGPLASIGRRFPLGAALAARTLAYALAVVLGVVAIITVVVWIERGASPATVLRSAEFWSFIRDSFSVGGGVVLGALADGPPGGPPGPFRGGEGLQRGQRRGGFVLAEVPLGAPPRPGRRPRALERS